MRPSRGKLPARQPKVDVDQVFRALGDSTRRAIVIRLSAGPAPASELAGPLGVSLAAIMQHLQVLQESGLVHTEKTGRVRTCHMDSAGLAAAEQWIHERRATWERRLDRLGALLDSEEPGA